MDKLTNKRNCSLDIARIIAVLAVVMIHCCATFITDYKPHTSEFIFGNLFESVARLGVPFFLMISGALFLDENKEITLKGILSKNVKNLAMITIGWAFIYAVIYYAAVPAFTGKGISVKKLLISIIDGHYHMWYLYMIIGLYVVTPFLKKFVCKENKGMVLFFIIVSFVVQFLLSMLDKICIQHFNIDYIGARIRKFHLDFFGGYITYFLVGWYIVHIGIKQKHLKYILYLLGMLSLATIIIYAQYTGDYKNAYENIGAPVFLYSVSTFVAINGIKLNFKEKTAERIAKLSKLTFGVYIIHVLILTVFCKVLPYRQHSVLYIVLCFVTVACSSFLCSYIISKIPAIKKLIKA